MSTLNLRQIQGFILRMYRMPMVRHFLLKVHTPAAARVLLGRLASGDERDAPQITTAEEWHVAVPGPEDDRQAPPRRQTDYCLNVGITWSGLVALEVQDRLPALFARDLPCVRRGRGEARRALGDRGASGPENWCTCTGQMRYAMTRRPRRIFRSLLANIPPGSLLYQICGKATQNAKQIYIGSITTESALVTSAFGDRILAFQHAWNANGSTTGSY